MIDDSSMLPVPVGADLAPAHVSPIGQLADNPEGGIWLSKKKGARTRRAYRLDVQHFLTRYTEPEAELRLCAET